RDRSRSRSRTVPRFDLTRWEMAVRCGRRGERDPRRASRPFPIRPATRARLVSSDEADASHLHRLNQNPDGSRRDGSGDNGARGPDRPWPIRVIPLRDLVGERERTDGAERNEAELNGKDEARAQAGPSPERFTEQRPADHINHRALRDWYNCKNA